MRNKTGYSVAGIVIGIVVVVFLGLATFFIIDGNNKSTNFNDFDFYSVIEAGTHNGGIMDHVKVYDPATETVVDSPEIAKNTPVLLYEYADFQCNYCALMNAQINAIIKNLEGKVGVVYRNYLLSYHQNGTAAASAAEAAGLQGYWKPYADQLYLAQDEWAYLSGSARTEAFNKYFMEVTEGKGDLDKFNADIASAEISKKISFDMGIGQRIDVGGTPAFYIDGKLIEFGNRDGGSITVAGQTFTWDSAMTNAQFEELISNIVDAKLAAGE